MYHCLTEERAEISGKEYFIHFPQGYKKREINKTVDISDVWDIKIAAMSCHRSQKHDMKRILEKTSTLPKEEYFIIKTK